MKRKTKMVITGANGVLGYAVAGQFQGKYDIILTGIEDSSPTAGILDLPYRVLDISKEDAIESLFQEINPEILVNCAAYTNVDACESDVELSYSINALGPKILAEKCIESGTLLIHYSSDYIFDGEKGPYKEDAEIKTLSEYGRGKADAEKFIQASDCHHIIIRTNVLFGKAPDERASFVRFVVESLENKKDIRIVDDQYSNPTWSNDLAKTTDVLMDKEFRGIINYGGDEYLNRYEFALKIAKIWGLDTQYIHKISTEELNLKAHRPLRGGVDNSRVYSIPGIPKRTLIDSLVRIKDA